MSLLEVKDLSVEFPGQKGSVKAVSRVSFEVEEGESFGIIGESGSGKSVVGQALLRLLPKNARISGNIRFAGQALFTLNPSELREIRGKRISLMPQNPSGALNPVLKNGIQLTEVFERRGIGKDEGLKKAISLMKKLFLEKPERLCTNYPHQLSGGMKQRLLAAAALSFEPELLIADEPTKGLDPEARAGSIELFMKIKKEYGKTMLLITHDLALALEVCDRVAVMYAGEIIELDRAKKILQAPRHPYTQGLLRALPQNGLVPLRGRSPSRIQLPRGCYFHERCKLAGKECFGKHPELRTYKGGRVRCHLQFLQ